MELIYINNEISSVFSSQIVALLNYYSNTGNFSKITLLCGFKNENIKTKYKNELKDINFEIIFYKTFANYPVLNLLTSYSLSKVLNQINCDFKQTVIHIRGESAAYLAISGLKKKFMTLDTTIVDIRGAAFEEINEFQNHNTIKRILKNINFNKSMNSLSLFKNISVVSDSLSYYISNNTHIDISKIKIVPCLASKKFNYDMQLRTSLRKKLGIKNNEKLLIFTSGGTAKWQNNEEILKLNKSFKILNLSPSKIIESNIINIHVPYNEVPQYLCASDAAIIFRDSSLVNKVSSPVKFSEYVCAGLPVITNTNVDQITKFIEITGFGIFINDLTELNEEMVSELAKIDRSKISEIGIKKFGIEKIAGDLMELYKSILN